MVDLEAMRAFGGARGAPIKAGRRGDFRNVVYGHRGCVLREVEVKRAGEVTNSRSST